jgi:hypothetical protein
MPKVRYASRRADQFIQVPASSPAHAVRRRGAHPIDPILTGLRAYYASLLQQPIPPRLIDLIEQFENRRHDGT